MYELFLFVHSWLRWLITIFLLLTFINALKNYMQNSIYTKKDRILGGILVGFVHLQLLMGFILYFALSPLTHVAMLDMGYAMKNPVLRYWSVEHLAGMVVFAVFVQIAQSSSKRARGDLKKHKRMAIFKMWVGRCF